jgi:hypothetical protein
MNISELLIQERSPPAGRGAASLENISELLARNVP